MQECLLTYFHLFNYPRGDYGIDKHIPANSHALDVSLTPASWKLQSHANSRLRTKFSRLDEKCELQQLELKHFPKRCKLTPIRETKTPCYWKSKWVYPKSPISMISDKKSIANEVVSSETLLRTGSERYTRWTSELFRTSSDVFGSLRQVYKHTLWTLAKQC